MSQNLDHNTIQLLVEQFNNILTLGHTTLAESSDEATHRRWSDTVRGVCPWWGYKELLTELAGYAARTDWVLHTDLLNDIEFLSYIQPQGCTCKDRSYQECLFTVNSLRQPMEPDLPTGEQFESVEAAPAEEECSNEEN